MSLAAAARLAALLAGSAAILRLSWRSLRRPAAHGFYRCFAFEAILGLIVLNAPAWFARPFAPRQLVSWLLLLASIPFAVAGIVLLRRLGRPRPVADAAPEFAFENTSALVTTGCYRWIRHPMYASLLLLAWGVFLKAATAWSAALVVLATAALLLTTRAEEAENLARFGPPYRAYMARTRRFIPFVL